VRNDGSIRISRRSAMRLLVPGIGALALGACVSPTPATPSATVAPNSAPPTQAASTPIAVAVVPTLTPAGTTISASSATPQPRSGGTIRSGQVGDIANLDGHYANQLSTATVQLAYDQLVKPVR